MLIISYDIENDKLRTKFSKFIKKYGHRLQYSVFEIDNSKKILDNIKREITNTFEQSFGQMDSVMIIETSKNCKITKWGYAKNDCNYKPVKEFIENLVDCRRYNCNFLLNTGLRGNGSVNPMDACILREIGKWVKKNKEAVYDVKSCDMKVENAIILQGKDCYYAIIKNALKQKGYLFFNHYLFLSFNLL